MRTRTGEGAAGAAGATIEARGGDATFTGATIDSREAGPGLLFAGLPGASRDGGEFASAALEAGAWGVLVSSGWAREVAAAAERRGDSGWVLGADDPLRALQALATARRLELGADVVGVTGSTGKTSVKDICSGLFPAIVHASPENYNTEIGLPLSILAAPDDAEALVLEMGMRGAGQIAELCEIAQPDVGVITNVGPVHVELLGSVEGVAAAKAEIIGGLRAGGTAVIPAGEPLLRPHTDATGAELLRFGPGGEVDVREAEVTEDGTSALITAPTGEQWFGFSFTERHNLANALAAIAAGVALGYSPQAMAARASRIVFSRLRGETVALPGGATVINDCYNANPISMRAALDHLGAQSPAGRRIAVLGEMRELGPDAGRHHREIGRHARATGVDFVIGVGDMGRVYEPDVTVEDAQGAAEALRAELREGDLVLVKGSRAVGLEAVARALGGEA